MEWGMAGVGRPKALLVLEYDEREQLTRWARFVAERLDGLVDEPRQVALR